MKIKFISYVYILYIAYNINILPAESWRTPFMQYNFTSITKILGYDPKISLYEADKNVIEKNNAVMVYAHGWGDSQESINVFKRNSFLLPGTVVGFNFRDAHRGSSLPPFQSLRFSNFAQEEDIATLLMTLKVLIECGIDTVHLFGHSRGGGTILTMLARLYSYDLYYNSFKKLNIDRKLAYNILAVIQKGSLVLNCPLVDTPQLIQEKLSWINVGFLSEFFSRGILPFFIKYRAYADIPLGAAYVLRQHKFDIPTFIHFQKDDVIIATRTDTQLYTALHGKNTYITIGNEGGHMHGGKQLSIDLQAFYREYGAAYYDDVAIMTESGRLLQKSQPSLDEFAKMARDLQVFNRTKIIQYTADKNSEWQQKLKKYNLTNVEKILGYSPQIRIYGSDALVIDDNIKKDKSATVYVHGLGENAQTVIPYFKINGYLLPGTVVGFDFPDAIPGTFATNFGKLNLAQEQDIAVLGSILKILDECGLEVIHLFGTSRGGGSIMNTLGRFCAYTKHKKFFETLEISEQQATSIINKILTGTIVLNVPLVDSVASAQFLFKWIAPIMNKFVHRYTQHRFNEDQAINAAKIIQNQHFNILVHFEHKDEIVGNSSDATFYKNIIGPNTYLVLADDGGHLHNGYTLEEAVQGFRKKHGGPYYNIERLLTAGDAILQQAQPQLNAVEHYVKNAYIKFEVERKRKKDNGPMLPI